MSIVGPFWLLGLAFGGLVKIGEIRRHIYDVRHYFTLDETQEVDGVAFPAGTLVVLDEDGALKSAEVPTGATVTLRAST